jgi:hypothetical protein
MHHRLGIFAAEIFDLCLGRRGAGQAFIQLAGLSSFKQAFKDRYDQQLGLELCRIGMGDVQLHG